MNTPTRSGTHASRLLALMLAASLPTALAAQQLPLTGQMMAGQQAASPVPVPASATPAAPPPPAASAPPAPPAPPPPPPPAEVAPPVDTMPPPPPPPSSPGPMQADAQPGDATRALLSFQVDGTAAGRRLPMLGGEAGASYRRYLDSFGHPIPEFYETAIQKSSYSGR